MQSLFGKFFISSEKEHSHKIEAVTGIPLCPTSVHEIATVYCSSTTDVTTLYTTEHITG